MVMSVTAPMPFWKRAEIRYACCFYYILLQNQLVGVFTTKESKKFTWNSIFLCLIFKRLRSGRNVPVKFCYAVDVQVKLLRSDSIGVVRLVEFLSSNLNQSFQKPNRYDPAEAAYYRVHTATYPNLSQRHADNPMVLLNLSANEWGHVDKVTTTSLKCALLALFFSSFCCVCFAY